MIIEGWASNLVGVRRPELGKQTVEILISIYYPLEGAGFTQLSYNGERQWGKAI